jgi:hypothetical protein
MKLIGVILMVAVLMAATATAESCSQEQLASVATEALKLGQMIGMMQAGEIFAKGSTTGESTYNEAVPIVNDLIRQHNELMMQIFAGNATSLAKLLVDPYDYL